MLNPVTIIAYHYVRDLRASRFSEIKGRDLRHFREQVRYLKRHYTFITAQDLAAAVEDAHAELPPNAALLSFDDGYIDHFQCAFPILDELGVQGSFFPAARAIAERRVLDVNKIHFILASVPEPARLVAEVFELLDAHRAAPGPWNNELWSNELQSNAHYYRRLAVAGRYDPPEVVFVKRLLQRELPERLRARITDELFRRHVTADEEAFACELYLSMDHLRCMQRNGMYVGSHGYGHYWMNTLPPDEQARDLDRSLHFLSQIGSDLRTLIMCYPYGGYDESLIAALKRRGFACALTTRAGLAHPTRAGAFELPRLDTNDLPTSAGAAPSPWTVRARKVESAAMAA